LIVSPEFACWCHLPIFFNSDGGWLREAVQD
jgi:hypothetical protein